MQLTFDFVSIFTTLGAAHGIFLSIAIMGKQAGNRVANRCLALFVFFLAICTNEGILVPTNLLQYVPHLLLTEQPLTFIEAPVFWLYVNYLTIPGYKIQKKTLLVFLPGIISIILLLPFFLQSGTEKVAQRIAMYQGDVDILSQVTWIISQLHMWTYLVIIWKKVQRFQQELKGKYSTIDEINLSWIKSLILMGATAFALFMVITICVLTGLMEFNLERANSFYTALIIYYIGYKGIRQPDIVLSSEESNVSEDKYERTVLSREESLRYKDELLSLMKTGKLFRNPNLTLNDLAGELSIRRNTLSRVINEELGQNFYDFVNTFRIEYIKEKLARDKDKNFTVLEMALEAGFNTKSTFNTVFKKITGQTPSEYKKSLLKN